MTEKELKIRIGDDLYIYGTLRGNYEKPFIVLCHGYGGWMHEMLLYNGARYFEKHGYSTLRLSMYGGGEKSRDITASDVITHAHDIDAVVEYLKSKQVSSIGVAGHSYSGLALVYSKKQDFAAAALWDPTHTDGYDEPETIQNLKDDFVYLKDLNAYVSGKGSGYIYAKTVFDNTYPKSNETAKKFTVPSVVINASWSETQQKYGKMYAQNIHAKTQHVVIKNASHPFTEEGAAEKLYAATVSFFADFLQK